MNESSPIADLLKSLEGLPPNPTRAEMDAVLRPRQSPALEDARRRAGLVRVLDQSVYAFLTRDVTGAPALKALAKAFPCDFEPVPPDSWGLQPSAREGVVAEWQLSEPAWREWNTRLVEEYYQSRTDKASELEAVYHAAGSTEPRRWIAYFEARYQAADDRNDFAHCHALLESVRSQEKFRGSDFSRVYRDKARYLQSRLMFLEALQKTATYIERQVPHAEMKKVLRRQGSAPWIFHLHATGGIGKTMLLRWHLARDLVRRRVPCAVVDFDNNLLPFVHAPFKLLYTILEQWGRQMASNVFASAVEGLYNARNAKDWDAETLARLHDDLQSVRLTDDMVILLDTLEEATLFHPAWLTRSLQEIRNLRVFVPRLTLLLAGRYDLERNGPIFETGEAITYELPRFSETESINYLATRHITARDMRAAIIERAIAGETPEPASADPAPAPLLNPFKLALLADLVIDHPGITPAKVRTLPSVDVAYLIERVIIRIESQPLRWMIRYGAIARDLTPSFLEHVLLPPLKEALRGGQVDLSTTDPSEEVQRYLDSQVTWQRDPDVANALSADALWSSLDEYARERGWISKGDTERSLRLHPEVVKPVRRLLSREPVYGILQQAARDFYKGVWTEPSSSTSEAQTAAVETIYHAAMIDAQAGRALWREALETAAPESRYAIASEPTRTSYRDDEGKPLFPEWLGEAEIESARVRMHQAGAAFSAASEASLAFTTHVTAARQTPAVIPPLFETLVEVEARPIGLPEKADAIEQALAAAGTPYDRLWLALRAAHYRIAATSDDRAVPHLLVAAAAAADAALPEVTPAHVELTLGYLYQRQRRYTDAMATYDRVRKAGLMVPATLNRQVTLALRHHDVERAAALLPPLELIAPGNSTQILALGLALRRGEISEFFSRLAAAREQASSDESRVALLTLEAEADRLLMNFGAALSKSFSVTELAASLDRTELIAPPGIPELEIYAFELGDVNSARQYLERVGYGEGRRISEDDQQFQLIRAFLSAQEGDVPNAAALARELSEVPSAVIAARARLLGLAFDLVGNPAEELARFLTALDGLDPPVLVTDVLELLEGVPQPSQSLSDSYTAISSRILGRMTPESGMFATIAIQLLDLARVCGAVPGEIWASLERARRVLPPDGSAGRVRLRLRLLDHYARVQAPPPFTYADLAGECQAAGAANTPLEALVKERAAVELAAAGNSAGAERLRAEAVAVWEHQPEGRYRTQVLGLPADPFREVPPVPPVESLRSSVPTAESEASLERLRGLARLVVDDRTTTALESQLDAFAVSALTRRLYDEWPAIQGLLLSTLQDLSGNAQPAAMQVVTTPPAAVLPWEFTVPVRGSRLLCRDISGVAAPPPLPAEGPTRVLLVKPGSSEAGDDLSSALESVSSGFSMEHLYQDGGPRDSVVTLESPKPDDLAGAIESIRPPVLHIIGQLRETPTGVCIDFEGSERRVSKVARKKASPGARADLGTLLEVSRLIHYLRGRAPVVILDITAPENVTDALRMLLLRNRFAAELYRSGTVRAVLATGLTGADERESFARALVSGVHDNTSLAFLWNSTRDDDEPQDLLELIAHCSSALFAHNPYARIVLEPNDSGRA